VNRATQRTIRLLLLGVGGVITLYLFTENLRFVSAGIVLVLAGYALALIGLMKEMPRVVMSTGAAVPEPTADPQ